MSSGDNAAAARAATTVATSPSVIEMAEEIKRQILQRSYGKVRIKPDQFSRAILALSSQDSTDSSSAADSDAAVGVEAVRIALARAAGPQATVLARRAPPPGNGQDDMALTFEVSVANLLVLGRLQARLAEAGFTLSPAEPPLSRPLRSRRNAAAPPHWAGDHLTFQVLSPGKTALQDMGSLGKDIAKVLAETASDANFGKVRISHRVGHSGRQVHSRHLNEAAVPAPPYALANAFSVTEYTVHIEIVPGPRNAAQFSAAGLAAQYGKLVKDTVVAALNSHHPPSTGGHAAKWYAPGVVSHAQEQPPNPWCPRCRVSHSEARCPDAASYDIRLFLSKKEHIDTIFVILAASMPRSHRLWQLDGFSRAVSLDAEKPLQPGPPEQQTFRVAAGDLATAKAWQKGLISCHEHVIDAVIVPAMPARPASTRGKPGPCFQCDSTGHTVSACPFLPPRRGRRGTPREQPRAPLYHEVAAIATKVRLEHVHINSVSLQRRGRASPAPSVAPTVVASQRAEPDGPSGPPPVRDIPSTRRTPATAREPEWETVGRTPRSARNTAQRQAAKRSSSRRQREAEPARRPRSGRARSRSRRRARSRSRSRRRLNGQVSEQHSSCLSPAGNFFAALASDDDLSSHADDTESSTEEPEDEDQHSTDGASTPSTASSPRSADSASDAPHRLFSNLSPAEDAEPDARERLPPPARSARGRRNRRESATASDAETASLSGESAEAASAPDAAARAADEVEMPASLEAVAAAMQTRDSPLREKGATVALLAPVNVSSPAESSAEFVCHNWLVDELNDMSAAARRAAARADPESDFRAPLSIPEQLLFSAMTRFSTGAGATAASASTNEPPNAGLVVVHFHTGHFWPMLLRPGHGGDLDVTTLESMAPSPLDASNKVDRHLFNQACGDALLRDSRLGGHLSFIFQTLERVARVARSLVQNSNGAWLRDLHDNAAVLLRRLAQLANDLAANHTELVDTSDLSFEPALGLHITSFWPHPRRSQQSTAARGGRDEAAAHQFVTDSCGPISIQTAAQLVHGATIDPGIRRAVSLRGANAAGRRPNKGRQMTLRLFECGDLQAVRHHVYDARACQATVDAFKLTASNALVSRGGGSAESRCARQRSGSPVGGTPSTPNRA